MDEEERASGERPPAAAREQGAGETRGERSRRQGRRARLYGWTILAIVLLGIIVAWVVANTDSVEVNWVVASTDAALALVIFVAAALGWALGLLTAFVIGRRTRAPARERRRPPEELI